MTSAPAHAQDLSADFSRDLSAGATEGEAPAAQTEDVVGNASSALPGLLEVGLPGLRPVGRYGFALTSGYGLTESHGPVAGSHHRLGGTIAASYAAAAGLDLALQFDGRFDSHPDDAQGSDSGATGAPTLHARYGKVSGVHAIGGNLALTVPGRDAPSMAFGASTVEAQFLYAWIPSSRLAVAGAVGYRLDNSAKVKPDLTMLRPGDRSALGLSDFDAAVVGVGASYRVGNTEILGEFMGRFLVGSGAPAFGESPINVGAGVRHHLSRRWQLLAIARVSPSKRPGMAPMDPLVPTEARFSANVGLAYGFLPDATSVLVSHDGDVVPPPPPPPLDKNPVADPPPLTPAPTAVVSLQLTDDVGRPVANARITVTVGDTTETGTTDADGNAKLEGVAPGQATVSIEASRFAGAQEVLNLKSGETAQVKLQLRPERLDTPGGQLRGLVRSFDGEAVSATIEIEPSGEITNTSGDGTFEVTLPPGKYRVKIKARGFASQYRSIRVEQNGVTILNADLRKRG